MAHQSPCCGWRWKEIVSAVINFLCLLTTRYLSLISSAKGYNNYRVVRCASLQLIAFVATIAYAVKRFSDPTELSLPEKSELIALVCKLTQQLMNKLNNLNSLQVIILRILCYFVVVFFFHWKMEYLIQRIIDDRFNLSYYKCFSNNFFSQRILTSSCWTLENDA